MTNNEYLNSIVQKYDKNYKYSQNEEAAFNNLKDMLQNWFNSKYYSYAYGAVIHNVSLEVQKSGSRAKGTAIKGSSDMDMFLSITDRYNEDQLENYYNDMHDFLKSKNLIVRKQNVSIGVSYYSCDIDVVPARKVNSSSYMRYNDHWLWSNKKQTRTLTNIQKHIDLVRNSGLQKEIMLTKVWRNKHDLDFSSFYIELMVIDALQNNRSYDLGKDFYQILQYIRDNIVNKKVVDPSNCNNIISETLALDEKNKIKLCAESSLKKENWEQIIW